MTNKITVYHISTWVGNYEVHGTGFTKKEAIDSAWKAYRNSGFKDFPKKSDWVEYHWGDDPGFKVFAVGDGWTD